MLNVFIDTQVFVQKNFNFNNTYFTRLISASSDSLISIYLTDVVKAEIESKIYEQVYGKVKNSLNKFEKEAKILKNLDEYNDIFKLERELDKIYKELINRFNHFLEEGNVELISVNHAIPATVFNMYFKGIPPFSIKKKVEFPDAFTLVALESWFKKNNEQVYIISDDSDLKEYCNNSDTLVYQSSLESLFDSIIEDYPHDFIKSVYNANYDEIKFHLKYLFEGHSFILYGEEGEIEQVSMDSIEIDSCPYIIEVNEEERVTATIAFNVDISFTVALYYLDYNNAYYDKEEENYLNLESISLNFTDNIYISVLMKFKYNYNDKQELEVDTITINDGEPIEIALPS